MTQTNRRPVRVVGLTSARNVEFCNSLGVYDEVLTYDQVTSLPSSCKVAVVDMAGNGALRDTIQRHFGDSKRHVLLVGMSHWEQAGSGDGGDRTRSELFFAPAYALKCMKAWGPAGFMARVVEAWTAFLSSDAVKCVKLEHQHGMDGTLAAYERTLEGLRPSEGMIVSMQSHSKL